MEVNRRAGRKIEWFFSRKSRDKPSPSVLSIFVFFASLRLCGFARYLFPLQLRIAVAALLAFCVAGSALAQEDAARSQVERGPVRLTVEIAPRDARLADDPVLTVTLDYEEGVKVHPPPFGDALGEFLIRDIREPLLQVRGDRETVRQIVTLEPTRTGKLFIPPIAARYVDARDGGDGREHWIESEPLTIRVSSVIAAERPSLARAKPLAPPLPPETARSSWPWIAAAIALALSGIAIWMWRRGRKAETLSPRERAERELTRLMVDDFARRDVKLLYMKLTGIVRRYVEQTTGVRAPERTTEEFLSEIGRLHDFTPEERTRLKEFLEAADLVKFAARRPRREDIEASVARARDFINPPDERREVAA